MIRNIVPKRFCLCLVRIIGVLCIAMTAGCASTGYLSHRGRDAADIFTCSLGTGLGVKARVGPVHAGLLANVDGGGLRGGRWEKLGVPTGNEFEIVCIGGEGYYPDGSAARRGKSFQAGGKCPFLTTSLSPYDGSNKYPAYYYTQVEAVLGLGISLRLGINPGELLDFILGWTTLDIYADDL